MAYDGRKEEPPYSSDSDVILNDLVGWAIDQGFSTGHVDTLNDLLSELGWQIKGLRETSRNKKKKIAERCAKIYLDNGKTIDEMVYYKILNVNLDV